MTEDNGLKLDSKDNELKRFQKLDKKLREALKLPS